MEIILLKQAQKDRDYWKSTGNTRVMKRISDLLEDINNGLHSLQTIFLYGPFS